MVWAASGLGVPVALRVCTIDGIQGLPTLLDSRGELACVYLGTDPALPPVAAPRREADGEGHAATAQEMRELERIIAAAGGSEAHNGEDGETAAGALIAAAEGDDLIIQISDIEPLSLQRRTSEGSNITFTHGVTVRLGEGRKEGKERKG